MAVNEELEQYKKQLQDTLEKLNPVFAKASKGDFSFNVEVPQKTDEISQLLAGIQILVEAAREKTNALETSNKHLEEEVIARTELLRASEERHKQIVENSTNLFYIQDANNTLTYVSPLTEQFFGMKPEEAKGKWTQFVTDNPINQKGVELTAQATKTGKAQPEYELELQGKNGKIWVLVNEKPIVREGKVVSIVGSLTDITKRKEADQALSEQQEELEKFNKLMVGRELKMIELKEELARLKKEVGHAG